jgi:hypothetical protein
MVCQQVTDSACLPELQIPILFDTRPLSLYDLSYPPEYPELGQITVPTPTLVGLPGNEADVQLLAQSYAAHIVPPALPTISGWQGERPLFYEAIVAKQLEQWGLRPSVLDPALYESLINPHVTLQEISLLWASDDFQSLVLPNHVPALIDFLVAQGATAVDLQNSLFMPNFWRWANLPENDTGAEQVWLQFLYDRSTFALQPPPLPMPERDIRLVCASDKLYRYNWATNLWQDEMEPYEGQSFVDIVPHDAGLIVAGRFYEEVIKDYRGRAFWMQEDESLQFSEWRSYSDPPLFSSRHLDPAGRELVFQVQDIVDRHLIRYGL